MKLLILVTLLALTGCGARIHCTQYDSKTGQCQAGEDENHQPYNVMENGQFHKVTPDEAHVQQMLADMAKDQKAALEASPAVDADAPASSVPETPTAHEIVCVDHVAYIIFDSNGGTSVQYETDGKIKSCL